MKLFRQQWGYYLAGLLVLIIILFEARGKGDFNIFLSASEDLLKCRNIYGNLYNEWYHYYYDVLFAGLLIPFTFLPLYLAKVIWLILNVFFIYRIWKVISGWLPLNDLSEKARFIFTIISFILIARFLKDNFHLSQVTVFILYLTIEGLHFIEIKKHVSGSLMIAAGITIKILPVVIIPYLLYRREFRSSIYIIIFAFVLVFIPGLIIGLDYNSFLLSERWQLINPFNVEHIADTSERSFHSITTLLSTLLVKNSGDYYALPIKRNIADVSIDSLYIAINAARTFFVLLTLLFLRSFPFKKAKNSIQKLYEISYICILIPLIFPHQQYYAFLFIFPATTYLSYFLVSLYFSGKSDFSVISKVLLIAGMSVVFLLTSSHLLAGEFSKYFDHFKILTYGVLLLIIILAICRPGKINNLKT